jgi:recombination protein RecT
MNQKKVPTEGLTNQLEQQQLPMGTGEPTPPKDVKPAIVDPVKTIRHQLQAPAFLKQLELALPKMGITPERMVSLAITELRQNPKLQQCNVASLMGAILKASQLGLEIGSLGEAYLVPYKEEATLTIGYQGLIALMYKSPLVKSISAQVVYENDHFLYREGVNRTLEHTPASTAKGIPLPKSQRGDAIAFYCIIHLANGDYIAEVMGYEDAMEHGRTFSPNFNSNESLWKKNPIAMGLKTVIRKAAKLAPKASEAQRALASDEKIVHVDASTGEILSEQYVSGLQEADADIM